MQLVIAFCVAIENLWIQGVSNQLNLRGKCETSCNEENFKTTLGSGPIIDGSIFPVVEYATRVMEWTS